METVSYPKVFITFGYGFISIIHLKTIIKTFVLYIFYSLQWNAHIV